MSASTRIAFIGTGVMGRSMAGHLLRAGHQLFVFNRTKAKAEPLLDAGAVWRKSPREAAREADVVITMVGFPADVESTYFGPEGIIENARDGALLIDMTTSSPELAKRIAETAKDRGLAALDAPVSGGDSGARDARLSIMVGGDSAAFDRAAPLFTLMGKNCVLQGTAGSGQYTKMCNQIAIASGMLGVCEAMIYAKKSGLDPKRVLQSIEHGAAASWSLSNLAPKMLADDFAPGFYVKHFVKDLGIAIESARAMNLDLPGLTLAIQLYEKLAKLGHADDGTQALFRLYLENSDR